jgi:hypothetical protein
LLVASSAYACGGRTSLQQYFYDGWNRSPGTAVGGAYATLDVRLPCVVSGDYSGYVVHVNKSGTGGEEYGWTSDGVNTHDVRFWLDSSGTGHQFINAANDTINSSAAYDVEWDPGSNTTTFRKNSSVVATYAGWHNFLPDSASITGELPNQWDQMPGNYNQPALAQQPFIYYSGGWRHFNGNLADNTLFASEHTYYDGSGNQINGDILDNAY